MSGAANIGDELVPDLANVSKTVRKRRAPKHDFKDGKGKVFAHRHDNGGGWVADTAYVVPTVKVTRNAQVFDFARVYDGCSIEGTSRVFGHAQLYNSARVYGDARVFGYSLVRNTARVGHSAVVSGAAMVSGNSQIEQRVVVTDQALVHGTTVIGPKKNATTRIDGAAKVSDSRLTGLCLVGGAALVDRCHINTVSIQNQARVSGATVHTLLPSGFHMWLAHSDFEWTGQPVTRLISFIEGTVVASYYAGPRLEMAENTLMARCHIAINMYQLTIDQAAEWPSLELADMATLIRVENARSIDAVRSRIYDGRNPLPIATPNIPQQNAYGGPAIPVRGVAPDPGVPRQRRLLRLGE